MLSFELRFLLRWWAFYYESCFPIWWKGFLSMQRRKCLWVTFFPLTSSYPQRILPGSVMGGTTGGRVNTTCLLDPDQARKTISLQMCGNGIVEPGEDCDSGTGVDSNCCDATCKFKNGAKCDPRSSSCCTEACTFAPVNQVCRPSRDPKCDTAEFCTGNSSTCPLDITVPNGEFSYATNLSADIVIFTWKVRNVVIINWRVQVASAHLFHVCSFPEKVNWLTTWCRAMSSCWRTNESFSSLSRPRRPDVPDILSGSTKS